MGEGITDWDDAYANGAYIDGAADYPPKWAAAAEAYRASATQAELDVPYGAHERQVMDIFWPDQSPRGVAVFVHGGYWMKFDKSYWSHLTEGARSLGWVVATPSYVLAPEATLPEITSMIGDAVENLAKRFEGPIRLAGHSAGGHLVSRLACQNGPLSNSTADRVETVVSISGLHDLGPLLKTAMRDGLRLTESNAAAESAALATPHAKIKTVAWVGADERPEFIRQTNLLEEAWRGKSDVSAVIAPGQHHFNVIEPLADPTSKLCKAFAG